MYIITSWKTTFLLLFSLDLEGETLLLINYLIYITLSLKLKMQVKKFSAILEKHLTVFGSWLKSAGMSGNRLSWFTNYLTGRKQRGVMSGVQSAWNCITAGVPQGSKLGPLLFLLFINDIVHDIGSSIRSFADDTIIYIIVENPSVAAELLNADLENIAE